VLESLELIVSLDSIISIGIMSLSNWYLTFPLEVNLYELRWMGSYLFWGFRPAWLRI